LDLELVCDWVLVIWNFTDRCAMIIVPLVPFIRRRKGGGAPPFGPVTLSATALTGLRAVDDGGTWAGVSDVGLPYDG
jgi:hypothetical protein